MINNNGELLRPAGNKARQDLKQLIEETRAQNLVLQDETTLLVCQIYQLQEEKESLSTRICQWQIVVMEEKTRNKKKTFGAVCFPGRERTNR
jgi:hypothetical protein